MSAINASTLRDDPIALADFNRELARLDAASRVARAFEVLPAAFALSSSFGAQAAVSLHLLTRLVPDVPVLFVDTGYLFPETYQFVDTLRTRLNLNLKVVQADESPAWFEARHGRLWEQGLDGIQRYNQMRKVAPMREGLERLGVATWFAGLRRQQSGSRAHLPIVGLQDGRFKVLPIVDWTDRDVWLYLNRHGLPYHPLWHQGYVSIGDTHTTRPLSGDLTEAETRFFGLKRECGLHEPGAETSAAT